MRSILCVIFCSHLSYLLAAPSPETNVQIQNYDGPIFLHSPKPNCCPLCSSILTYPLNEDELKKTFEANPENYPRKAVYGNTGVPETNCRKDTQENHNEGKVSNGNMVPYSNTYAATSDNSGLLRTDSGKLNSGINLLINSGNTYPGSTNDRNRYSETGNTNNGAGNNFSGARPGNNCAGIQQGMNYKGTRDAGSENNVLGNNYTKTGPSRSSNTGAENTYTVDCTRNLCNTPGSSGNTQVSGNFYNTPSAPTVIPLSSSLSSYLPMNTATESGCTCFTVPMAVYNPACPDDETVLVPQKFSYSLVLDGEVAPSCQNGPYECKCYCYY